MQNVHQALIKALLGGSAGEITHPDSIAMVDGVAGWAGADRHGLPVSNFEAAMDLRQLAKVCVTAAEDIERQNGLTATDGLELERFRAFLREAKDVPRGPELGTVYKKHYPEL